MTPRVLARREIQTRYGSTMRGKGRTVPPEPRLAEAIQTGATPDADGCLISPLSPSRPRPFVYYQRTSVSAIRVVAAAHLGRVIGEREEVHHRCGKRRCVRGGCLEPMSVEDHSRLHAEQLLARGCVKHSRPWDRLNARGHGECILCGREKDTRWRAKGTRVFTEEQKRERARRNREWRARRKAAAT